MRDFRKLKVWESSHKVALAVYRVTAGFLKQEVYGLTSQLRRASTSVPANIAEGCGRSGSAELVRFCHIAMGSASELEYYLLLARDLKFYGDSEYEALARQVTDIKRMLTSLIQRLKD